MTQRKHRAGFDYTA